ncbi:MAG: hypothetical protein IKK04_04035 [Bacteroidales bacterium]|nr:hypothetical protein [Bacteroidales bacterium]
MKERLLLTILLLTSTIFVHGQTTVWEMDTLTCDTTIVRHWEGDKYIIYTNNSSGQGTVHYHDNASGTTVSADLPANVFVRDFRIAHDTVFAGGNCANQGFLACFDINMFVSGLFAPHFLFSPSPYTFFPGADCGISGNIKIVDVTRIALFEDGGATRIAYIAENHNYFSSPSVYDSRVGYGDAAFLSGTWDVCTYYYNKDAWDLFTDICVTRNNIVLTARSDDYINIRFQAFKKVRDFANVPNFPPGYGFDNHKAIGKVMVTPIKDDIVSIAYHYSESASGGLAIRTIDFSSVTPSLLCGLDIPENISTISQWHMDEMRYSKDNDVLLILNQIYDPLDGCKPYIFCLTAPLSPAMPSTLAVEYYPLQKEMQSLDLFDVNRLITSGHGGSSLASVATKPCASPAACSISGATAAHTTSPTILLWNRHQCTFIPPNSTGYNLDVTYSSNINLICN